MELLPAIDLRDGRCVRLLKGNFEQETRYPVDPVALAVQYRELGARWLHVVDLDGAKRGEPVNLELIRRMRETAQVSVQLGGGIRTRESLDQALDVAERAVVGSLAVSEPEIVAGWLAELGPERLTLALDVRLAGDGTPMIATSTIRFERVNWPRGDSDMGCPPAGKGPDGPRRSGLGRLS